VAEGAIRVEVAYALPEEQLILQVEGEAGLTVQEAIESSGILQRFPEIDLGGNKVGIFGKIARLDGPLRPGDRVEIYRPLVADPKEARRERAARKQAGE
jgi:putative ubiquitin-RnfH superfamily antitoxin RatB of RatAB toxin-antitoxin module